MNEQGDIQLENLIRREAEARGNSKAPDHLRESFLLECISAERAARERAEAECIRLRGIIDLANAAKKARNWDDDALS
jgi:hypothetical protein